MKKSEKKENSLEKEGNIFTDFGEAVVKGNAGVKASLLVMGAGFAANGQVIKGILVTIIEVLFIVFMCTYGASNLSKFGTLGTVQYEQTFDPLTMQATTNNYDNSFLILLSSVVVIFLIIVFVLFYVKNMGSAYEIQKRKEKGLHINSFGEDMKDLFGHKFHLTLLSLPVLGVVLMNILPIMVLIFIAFTNYDQNHMPPTSLFTWVGWQNFKNLFTSSLTSSFSYSFRKILGWTFLWAIVATLTCFILGILLAKLINSSLIKAPKVWRTIFIIAIAVPQFVTLLLVRNFFGDNGIVNTICSNIGVTDFLKTVGLVNSNLNYIPFLTSPGWAKFMIIMINIWVGVPYQMLIATGVLMNVPNDQIEAARIDGATGFQTFTHITMPYVLFIEGPALITDFVRNINNFNVIYLLTQDTYVTTDQALANSHGKEVDLLITWLFRLTNEYYDYKMASVIGIIVFIICAAFTILSFSRIFGGDREEVYQ